jgi:hypothetical protein
MHRGRLNLALLVIALGLGAAVWLSQKKEEHGPPLTPLTAEQLTRIRIAHPDAPAIELRKDGGKWRLAEPVQIEADEFEVNGLVALADKETKDRLDAPDLPQLGLAPPQYTITLNETAIEFGAVEPLQYRRYVKVGDVVATIDDPPSAALDKDYADLVAKELLAAGTAIERIELPKLTLAKDASGKWQVTPASPKATADAMQKLADDWQRARSMWNETAKDTSSPGKADPGKRQVRKIAKGSLDGERVRIGLKGGTTREFVVAATEPQLKLQAAGTSVVYVLSKSLVDELFKLPEPKPEPAPPPGAAGPGDNPAADSGATTQTEPSDPAAPK